jgi:hypothetical protein
MTLRTVTYRREVLYEEVWREPATEVARRYSISSVALGKICRELGVPVPGRGYWAKHAFGKAPSRPPLPALSEDNDVERRATRRAPKFDLGRIAASHAIGRVAMGAPIVVPPVLTQPHPAIASAMSALGGATLRNGLAYASGPCLDIVVSPSLCPRALRVANALILALEERGLPVEVRDAKVRGRRKFAEGVGTTRVLVDGEWIRFQLVEELVQFTPPITKKAPKNLNGSELELWRYWNRPRLQLVPSGKLILRIRERAGVRSSWRDGCRPVEEKLNSFIKQLFVVSDARKQTREAHARWRHDVEEREQGTERRRARAERRKRRSTFVREQLERWRDARDLRALVAEARIQLSRSPQRPEPSWLAWATHYADRIDPVWRLGAAVP